MKFILLISGFIRVILNLISLNKISDLILMIKKISFKKKKKPINISYSNMIIKKKIKFKFTKVCVIHIQSTT